MSHQHQSQRVFRCHKLDIRGWYHAQPHTRDIVRPSRSSYPSKCDLQLLPGLQQAFSTDSSASNHGSSLVSDVNTAFRICSAGLPSPTRRPLHPIRKRATTP
ncbi:hypothetical protein CGCVW01_v009493 [Colletotrichum viniferum]|nr:hypothetical protein CGCVW01_v009493 [Colletotrichum viniferum]